MDKKTLSIVAYITLIGWVISYVVYSGKEEKTSFERFHIKQALGLGILGFGIFLVSMIFIFIIPFLSMILNFASIGVFVLWILGIINAANEEEKPVPLVGEFIDKTLTFIQ
jgi:uncharacterized membrane protein